MVCKRHHLHSCHRVIINIVTINIVNMIIVNMVIINMVIIIGTFRMPMQIITDNTLSGVVLLSDNRNIDNDDANASLFVQKVILQINFYVFLCMCFVCPHPPQALPPCTHSNHSG